MATTPERRDIEFKTLDGVILRGWFYPAPGKDGKAPVIVISHGWACLKEMYLDTIAAKFQQDGLASLVYDHRNIGASDGLPRFEIDTQQQCNDIYDAVSFATSLPEVDASKVALWGYSLSGGHVVKAAAIDRRIKAIVTVAPALATANVITRVLLGNKEAGLAEVFMNDREARVRGEEPAYGLIISENPIIPCFMPHSDATEFYTRMQKTVAPMWENKHTLQSLFKLMLSSPGTYIENISPTPWLMIQGDDDKQCTPDIGLPLFEQAEQPKELFMYKGGHFAPFTGELYEKTMAKEIEFLKRHLEF